MSDEPPPPYRIETERLVIRCYEPRDAPLLADAVESSREHLARWLPWANETHTPAERLAQVCRFRGKFDLGQDFTYAILERAEGQLLGGSGLHLRAGPGAREIGYWIRSSALRQGLAREAASALTRVGFECVGLDRIDIRVVPENTPSALIPAALGYTREATLARRLELNGELRDLELWSLFAADYPQTPPASLELAAYDAAGAAIDLGQVA